MLLALPDEVLQGIAARLRSTKEKSSFHGACRACRRAVNASVKTWQQQRRERMLLPPPGTFPGLRQVAFAE
jgi:hypothetical protein